MTVRRVIAVFGLFALLVSGCDGSAEPTGGASTGAGSTAAAEPALRPAWQPLTLPAPPGGAGRLLLRDGAACAGRWFLVGGVADTSGGTRPAAWTSVDGATWTVVPVRADSFYGRQNVLSSVACRDGKAAVIGAKVGGAHGYPRISTWRQLPDGALVEVQASFETYGGPTAVNVSRLAAGAPGWLIVGNRSAGAASWVSSPPAAEFALVEGAPELASDAVGVTWAFDAVAAPPGWLAVGGLLPAGRIDRDPAVWSSPDGRSWRRTVLPGGPEYEELQRVVLVGGVPVAVGLRGSTFGAWRQEATGWVAAGAFGRRAGSGVPGVTSLVVAGDRLVVAVADGARHSVWVSADRGGSWREAAMPLDVPAGADRDVALVAVGDRWWLVADDGSRAGLWWAGAPGS
ncbi:hypothetical protein [Micromonospora cremea]|uniref:BNR repeat-like domain-containing protein n=1 Tax=Micromonospora cremea TaxID=709881 RepID=A0A1N5YGA7_9ACTN|nr:hypothetical protein [Micromonospora cremea]SIN08618.1 hypothetical protein SAMN04489832_2906 [Micromonospora cremea]